MLNFEQCCTIDIVIGCEADLSPDSPQPFSHVSATQRLRFAISHTKLQYTFSRFCFSQLMSNNKAHVSFLFIQFSQKIDHIQVSTRQYRNYAEKLLMFMRIPGEGIRLKHSNPPKHTTELLPLLGQCWLFCSVSSLYCAAKSAYK